MRSWVIASMGLMLGASASSARAQGATNFLLPGQHASTLLGSVTPVVNQPISITNLAAPLPNQAGSSWFTSLFKGFSTPSFPPNIGGSPLPSPSAYPSYPSKLVPMAPTTSTLGGG
jgi:hypothetical protein